MSADPQPQDVPRRSPRRRSLAALKSGESFEGSLRLRLAIPREMLHQALSRLLETEGLSELRRQVSALRVQAVGQNRNRNPRRGESAHLVWFKASIWHRYLEQIEEARTLKRAHYYVERLRRSLEGSKTPAYNDLNLYRWQEYDDILTDSLWLLEKRDRSGVHNAGYWGNFVPQIPHQLLRRYTKAGEWVIDPFLGSGTTLIECQRLGRNGLGVELQPHVAERTSALIASEDNPEGVNLKVAVGDSRHADYPRLLAEAGARSAQFVMLHPPYHDIIRFSESPDDLSNAGSLAEFLEGFGAVASNALRVLDKGRYLAVVIGDKYSGSEWIPLGFYCMQALEKLGCTLKSVIVKNFEATAGKRQTSELWRYRALAGGFYVFKHEYIFVMQKG